MSSRRLVAATVASLAAFALASPAEARPSAERHCVVSVTGQEADGELILSAPVCHSSRDEARTSFAVAGSFAIGTHYDGANFTGSSITVTGSNCAGGYVNLSSTWRNRISSSWNGCPVVRFFDGANLTGASETMVTSGNLWALNNRADSIQYSS